MEGFTEKYNVVRLVYFEQFDDPENAIDLYPGIAGAEIGASRSTGSSAFADDDGA